MRKGLWTAILLLAAVSLITVNPSVLLAQGKGPIKIGFIAPFSGGFAAQGKDMLAALQLYFEEIGYQAAGRKIELIMEDDEANPAVGLTKTRKLVEKDGVHLMTGGMMASTGYALAPYIDSQEIPMTYPVISSDDLTQRKIPKWIVRTGWCKLPAPSAFRRVCLYCPQVQEDRHHRLRFRLWLGVRRIFP